MISNNKALLILLIIAAISVIVLFSLNLYQERKPKDNDHSSWTILGFTDINYLPVAKLWYQRLSEVGYDNHMIVALDNSSYKNITIESKYRCEKGAGELQETGFRNVVKLRLATILKHLQKGKNVFVSDVDTYWNFFFDLHKLPIHYDIFHAFGTKWPPKVFKKWGFTLCTCVAGYRGNAKTFQLFRKITKTCGKKCSDQQVTNEIYAFVYNVKWHNNTGFSPAYNLRIDTFRKDFVARTEINCISWISVSRSAKTATAKLKDWKLYKENCQSHLPIN